MSGVKIPSDEALRSAYGNPPQGHVLGLRAVATLAAKQAAEQAVKEAVLRIESWAIGVGNEDVRRALRHLFASAFRPEISGNVFKHTNDGHGIDVAPTPPKEQQQMPTDAQITACADRAAKAFAKVIAEQAAPSPDPATVRMCIEKICNGGFLSDGSPEARVARTICDMLERDLLPKPTPAPEPERYVTLKEVEAVLRGAMPTDTPGRIAAEVGLGQILGRLGEIATRHGLLTPEQAEKVAGSLGVFGGEMTCASFLDALRLAANGGLDDAV